MHSTKRHADSAITPEAKKGKFEQVSACDIVINSPDLLLEIFQLVGHKMYGDMRLTCKSWNELLDSDNRVFQRLKSEYNRLTKYCLVSYWLCFNNYKVRMTLPYYSTFFKKVGFIVACRENNMGYMEYLFDNISYPDIYVWLGSRSKLNSALTEVALRKNYYLLRFLLAHPEIISKLKNMTVNTQQALAKALLENPLHPLQNINEVLLSYNIFSCFERKQEPLLPAYPALVDNTQTFNYVMEKLNGFTHVTVDTLKQITQHAPNPVPYLQRILSNYLPNTTSQPHLYHLAASLGKLDVIKLFRQYLLIWDSTCLVAAASKGHLECMNYLHQNGCGWSTQVCQAACTMGHLECLQYAHENGCSWENNIACYATSSLECLRYVVIHEAPLTEDVIHTALEYQNLATLEYLLHFGGPWNLETVLEVSRSNIFLSTSCLKIIISNLTTPIPTWTLCFAACIGNLDAVQYLYKQLRFWPEETSYAAAMGGHVEVLKWIVSQGLPIHSSTLLALASRGSKFFARTLFPNCEIWARNYYLKEQPLQSCLDYLISLGHSHPLLSKVAAKVINVFVLKYIAKHNLDWHPDTVLELVVNQASVDIIRFVTENNCPWHPDTYKAVLYFNHPGLVQYASDYCKKQFSFV